MKPRKRENIKDHLQKQLKSQFLWNRTFWSVFNAFRETSNGTIKSISHVNTGKGAPLGHGHVKPTHSDFVSDVEIAARTVLTKTQLRQFHAMREMRKVPEDIPHLAIMEKCGAEFFRRGIHPLQVYFKDVYCVPPRRNHA